MTCRRVVAAVLALAAAGGAGAGAAGCGSGGSGRYRVDAVFDNAGFLTPDTDVRVAGAKVGSVTDLTLTRDHKALVKMEVDRKFAPFHADADCTIQSQSLISEKFVDCTPGTPNAPALRAAPGRTPVLSVANTHAPVDTDLLLNVFQRPVRERLSLLLGALGTSLSGRGEDLNAVILRAAPALQETRRMLAVFDRDRSQLRQLIADSDQVLQGLGKGSASVAAFVREAGAAATTSGQRRERLATAIHRLPALLSQAQPSLRELTRFAQVGTPFAKRLDAAAPGLRELVSALGPFAQRTAPTLTRLGITAQRSTPQLRGIDPQVRRLARFAKGAVPAGSLLAQLLQSAKDSGVPEGLGNLGYYGATALARFDKYSHILPAYSLLGNTCATVATTPDPTCDAHYKASTAQRAAFYRALREQQQRGKGGSSPAKVDVPSVAKTLTDLLPKPPAPHAPAAPPAPKVLQTVLDDVGRLLGGGGQSGSDRQQGNPVADLLGYLLK